jgi:hypothetical protein
MNWSYCYKIKNGQQETTNLLYTPLKNDLGDTLCMKWSIDDYQKSNENLDQDLIDFFFDREVRYLSTFQDRPWTPKIQDIDIENKKIFLEWNNESINSIINDPNRDLDRECPDWRNQIFNILDDINRSGYYKLALYPHCFFINKDGIIKTIDFYSVIEKDYPFVERKIIEGMIGKDSTGRFDQATAGGIVNFKTFFEITMTSHLEKTWFKDNPFPEFYSRLVDN